MKIVRCLKDRRPWSRKRHDNASKVPLPSGCFHSAAATRILLTTPCDPCSLFFVYISHAVDCRLFDACYFVSCSYDDHPFDYYSSKFLRFDGHPLSLPLSRRIPAFVLWVPTVLVNQRCSRSSTRCGSQSSRPTSISLCPYPYPSPIFHTHVPTPYSIPISLVHVPCPCAMAYAHAYAYAHAHPCASIHIPCPYMSHRSCLFLSTTTWVQFSEF